MRNPQSGRRRRGGGRPQSGPMTGRVEQRQRGNANQLLEKYKNMARDAAQSGERVQAEYYLQFADHYFRVVAEQQARKEEQQAQRQKNRRDRNEAGDNEGDENEGGGERDDERTDQGRPRRARGGTRANGKDMRDGDGAASADAGAEAEQAPRRKGRPRKQESAKKAPADA